MEYNLNDLRRRRDRINCFSWLLFLGGLLLGSMDLLLFIKLIGCIEKIVPDDKFIKYILGFIGCSVSLMGVEITSVKLTKKEKEINKKITSIEDDKNKKETMDDIKRKFESLSRDKQLQLLQFIKNDESIRELVPQIVCLDRGNQEKIQMELDSIYNGRISENVYLEYVIEQIESFCGETPEHIVAGVMGDIKQNRNLLKEYFSYIDWSKVNLDMVYERLFNELEYIDNKSKFTRIRSDKK